MTNREAIDAIKANYPNERYTMLREALDIAIETLEKQEPTKPVHNLEITRCGNCNCEIDKYEGVKYCSNCGREVKWDD